MARVLPIIGALWCSVLLTVSPAGAAPVHQNPSQRPSITIVSPPDGATVRGSSVTVSVVVQHFRLVTPVLKNPPILQGAAGHIHYVLDSMKTFRAGRDMSASESHTWTHVPPGRHTVIAYLATSQHIPFPGVRASEVRINVIPAGRPAPGRRSHMPTLSSAPRTGGGAVDGIGPSSSSPGGDLLVLAIASIAAGLALLAIRWAR